MAASSFLLMFLVSLILIAATVESRQATAYFPGSVAHSSQEEAAKTLKHDETPYKTQYFPQILDHFNFQPESSKVFYQKYLINSKFWHKGAPIFVYTGNEGNIEWFANNTGFMLDIAPQFHALLVFIEVSTSSHTHTHTKIVTFFTKKVRFAKILMFPDLFSKIQSNLQLRLQHS